MTKIVAAPRLDFRARFEIDEGEARFLDALVGYGGQNLIDAVKKHLGKAYIDGYEDDGVRFCETLRQELPRIISQFRDARAVFEGEKTATDKPRPAPRVEVLSDV